MHIYMYSVLSMNPHTVDTICIYVYCILYMYMRTHIHTRVYACMYVCMYIYIYIYIHTYMCSNMNVYIIMCIRLRVCIVTYRSRQNVLIHRCTHSLLPG